MMTPGKHRLKGMLLFSALLFSGCAERQDAATADPVQPAVVGTLPAEIAVMAYIRPEYWERYPGGCQSGGGGEAQIFTHLVRVPLGDQSLLTVDVVELRGNLRSVILQRSWDKANQLSATYDGLTGVSRLRLGSEDAREFEAGSAESRYMEAIGSSIVKANCPKR